MSYQGKKAKKNASILTIIKYLENISLLWLKSIMWVFLATLSVLNLNYWAKKKEKKNISVLVATRIIRNSTKVIGGSATSVYFKNWTAVEANPGDDRNKRSRRQMSHKCAHPPN